MSEQGRRQNNEDNFGYDTQKNIYVVCDGVGGAEKGEVASDITVKTFVECFQQDSGADIGKVLQLAEQRISAHVVSNPDAAGMATTLTFTHVKNDGILVAWVGDSRIYQFRSGKIVFRSKDHSWVNEAVEAGIITPAEAENHPKANVITRAVQGSQKPVKADVQQLTDVQAGDIILQCSDGILEAWSDDELALASASHDPESLIRNLQAKCQNLSRDNYTAVVYQIESSDLVSQTAEEEMLVEAVPLSEKELEQMVGKTPEHSKSSVVRNGLVITVILLAGLFGWVIMGTKKPEPQEQERSAREVWLKQNPWPGDTVFADYQKKISDAEKQISELSKSEDNKREREKLDSTLQKLSADRLQALTNYEVTGEAPDFQWRKKK